MPACPSIFRAPFRSMRELLPQAESYARPLLTNFRVGAVVRSQRGDPIGGGA